MSMKRKFNWTFTGILCLLVAGLMLTMGCDPVSPGCGIEPTPTPGPTPDPGGDDVSWCLDGITNYDSNGPFTYRSTKSGSVNMWIPNVPEGCKVPMVHYSNGTGATCSFYRPMLTRLASHGFLTLCYEDTNTGAGTQGMVAFDTALREHSDIAAYKFGSTGHSQGGMASFNVLARAEDKYGDGPIYAGLAMEPASGFGTNPSEGWQNLYRSINSPMAMFSGVPTDTLVQQSWVQRAFDALSNSTEAYFYGKTGANHITTINQDGNVPLISWFRWKLLGDQAACQYFRSIPNRISGWSLIDSQNVQSCN